MMGSISMQAILAPWRLNTSSSWLASFACTKCAKLLVLTGTPSL